MKMLAKSLTCACLAAFALPGAAAAYGPAAHQDSPEKRRAGQGLSIREIEKRVIPRVPGAQYLGFDYDPVSDIYTLKFLRNGSVIWVDVIGRTGAIISRRGN